MNILPRWLVDAAMDETPASLSPTMPHPCGVFFVTPRRLAVTRRGARLATFACVASDEEVMIAFSKAADAIDPFPGVGVCETINLRDWNMARTMFALGILTERGMIKPEAP